MRSKKLVGCVIAAAMMLGCVAGCGSNANTSAENNTIENVEESTVAESTAEESTVAESTAEESTTAENTADFDVSKSILVTSREDGSGTRGAFIELFGIEQKDADGNKVDYTTVDANITNSTSVMMSTVAGDEYAIGYISLGSLNDSVKAVKIDGVDATVENIKSGDYKIARPFNIVTKEGISETAQDFIDFIMSSEGQEVVEQNGYIPNDDAESFSGKDVSGKVVVAGSSSVSPVMEKLKEAYEGINGNVEVEIQTSDSTTGVTSTIEGICDIGMASRSLKDNETGVETTTIAMDGIAVIVNNASVIDELSSEEVMKIFMGEITSWEEIVK